MATHTAGGSTVAKSNESKKRLGRGLDSLMGMAGPPHLPRLPLSQPATIGAQPKPDGGSRRQVRNTHLLLAKRGEHTELQIVAVRGLRRIRSSQEPDLSPRL